MSSANQTLEEVSRLLNALPGIEVLERRVFGRNAIIEIASRGAASTQLIQDLSLAANVSLERSSPELALGGVHHFSLTASTDAFDSIGFGFLQLLGIHLVWHLHHAGKIRADAANQLLHRWDGAAVGA